MAAVGQSGDAMRLAGEAERVARDLSDGSARFRALSGVAVALASAGQGVEAERIAGGITADVERAEALSGVAVALASAGHAAEAERIAIDTLLVTGWTGSVGVLAKSLAGRMECSDLTSRLVPTNA